MTRNSLVAEVTFNNKHGKLKKRDAYFYSKKTSTNFTIFDLAYFNWSVSLHIRVRFGKSNFYSCFITCLHYLSHLEVLSKFTMQRHHCDVTDLLLTL